MEIKIDNSAQDYLKSLKYMENRVNEIIKNQNDELAWLLSHPAIYTSGSTDHKSDLLNNNKIPVLRLIGEENILIMALDKELSTL